MKPPPRREVRGWLLDLYTGEEGSLVLWIIGENGERQRFFHDFPITFYAAGPDEVLRQVWQFLQKHPVKKTLARSEQQDLFSGPQKVLAVSVANPAQQPRCFHDLWRRFPALTYYNTDIPLTVRYAAAFDLFPLARCRLIADEADRVQEIEALDSPWDLDPEPPPLRVLRIEPNVDPQHAAPRFVTIYKPASISPRNSVRIPIKPWRGLLLTIRANINRYDPDLILTRWGDTWLFPRLMAFCKRQAITYFNPNRDGQKRPLQRKENSYFTYGQIVYRGSQFHLFGRWHIDQQNAVMLGDYGLDGVLEQARVSGLPVQEVARKSPGAGVTALQMQMALRRGILVPHTKQQAEAFKTLTELIRADRGGLVYQPLIGVHRHVAEIDFISMYPGLMVHFNVSPETVGRGEEGDGQIPELGIPVDQSREGIVPAALRPLIAKRLAIKEQLAGMDPRDCRYQPLKARAAGLKWLLVVCFGYLGYKNARFGRIEAHEAVTACSRDVLLAAKETAEAAGYQVLHMYIDALWVKREGATETAVASTETAVAATETAVAGTETAVAGTETAVAGTEADAVISEADARQLLDAVAAHVGIPIALEGIYRWVAFLSSRLDERVPVPNRYFGVFTDGTLKTRGIEMNRGDTPPFIAAAQREILQLLAALPQDSPLADALPQILSHLRGVLAALRDSQLAPEMLLVTHRVSRLPDEFRAASPAARALRQLAAHGHERRPGQRVQFIYTRGDPGVHAWDLPQVFNPATVDVGRYSELLIRATDTVLRPLGISQQQTRTWLLNQATQLELRI